VRFTEQAIESLKEHTWAGNVRELSNLIERMIIMYGEQVVNVGQLPLKYQHLDIDDYQPEYPEELQEREAINDMFSGADYDDEEEAMAETSSEDASADSGNSLDVLPNNGLNLKEYLADLEISLINQALGKNDWVVARSAELLGMRRTTLVEKMRKYNLQKVS
jgi:sigma-54 specific flagellar transcriptional regulator A